LEVAIHGVRERLLSSAGNVDQVDLGVSMLLIPPADIHSVGEHPLVGERVGFLHLVTDVVERTPQSLHGDARPPEGSERKDLRQVDEG
jgi:hypothetical protein